MPCTASQVDLNLTRNHCTKGSRTVPPSTRCMCAMVWKNADSADPGQLIYLLWLFTKERLSVSRVRRIRET